MLSLDHIAIVARTLEDGTAWAEERLGVSLLPGGTHAHFGTHNRLLGLGDIYLEVIAKDPAAAATSRPTWFGLDDVDGPPRLGNWICASDDLDRDLKQAPDAVGPAVSLRRDALHWRITVPEDGSLPLCGAYPSLLQWGPGVTPPAQALPDSGCRLLDWQVRTPTPDALAGYPWPDDPRIRVVAAERPGFAARIATPAGEVTL